METNETKAVLFFDIDMTLTDPVEHLVPESAVRAIRKAQENGHLCFVNTGRPYTHIDPCVLEIPFDGLVCGCGVQLRLREPDGSYAIVYDVHPSPEVQREIRDTARASRIPAVYEDDSGIYYDGEVPVSEASQREHARLVAMGVPGSTDVYREDFRFAKFLIDEGEGEVYEKFLELTDRNFFRVPRGGFYECVPIGCTKGTGLEHVMERFGAGRVSYAFGDSPNDLEMLSHADVAVVMGNGMDSVKAHADFVTKAIDDDGIAYALEHFGLV
ncbi:MAG: HAD hydrolase family protein [Clostridia bacterium]|nr:HAD hydrolase family protein [Clostridia bacterium]